MPPDPVGGSADDAPDVVLFDGVCNVCNAAVNFVIDRDPRGRFRFASLQSETGRRLRKVHRLPESIDTLVLVEAGRVSTESTAALRIARHLSFPWPALFVLVLIPRFVRDAAYRYFAAHRYAWFGKTESCRVPTPDIRRRFIEDGSVSVLPQ